MSKLRQNADAVPARPRERSQDGTRQEPRGPPATPRHTSARASRPTHTQHTNHHLLFSYLKSEPSDRLCRNYSTSIDARWLDQQLPDGAAALWHAPQNIARDGRYRHRYRHRSLSSRAQHTRAMRVVWRRAVRIDNELDRGHRPSSSARKVLLLAATCTRTGQVPSMTHGARARSPAP